MSKLTDAKVIIECNYFTRPGAKKEQVKSAYYKRTKKAKNEIENYSFNVKLGAAFKSLSIEASAAIKSSWASTHSFSESTEDEEYRSEEKTVEYYENTTLLIRAITFSYHLDRAFVVHKEETIVQDVKESYSLDQLIRKAKKYMKAVYGVKNRTIVEIGLKIKRKIKQPTKKTKWDPYERGDILPLDAVFAGCVVHDGAVFVGRFNNTPGKVNVKDGKSNGNREISNFWVHKYKQSRTSGEVLRANGHIEWKEFKPGRKFPAHSVYSGLNVNGHPNWVGKSITGEPGRITCKETEKLDGGNTMKSLWCHHLGRQTEGFVLTIS